MASSAYLRELSNLTILIGEQRAWMDSCGGEIVGYLQRYGSPWGEAHGLGHCYGDGGAAIYAADKAELDRLENARRRLIANQRA